MAVSVRPEMTVCGWQDVKIQLTNQLIFLISNSAALSPSPYLSLSLSHFKLSARVGEQSSLANKNLVGLYESVSKDHSARQQITPV